MSQNITKETILVLGNGFDMAHGLPTSYMDFIHFEQTIKELIVQDTGNCDVKKVCNDRGLCKGITDKITEYMGNVENTVFLKGNLFQQKEMWRELLEDNYWILHFENCKTIGEGWIDFEAEMSAVLEKIDKMQAYITNEDPINYVQLGDAGLLELSDYLDSRYEGEELTITKIIKILLESLNKLRRALEIYLSVYVDQLAIKTDSRVISKVIPSKVISFNYTRTYEKTYGQDNKDIDYTYIHGIADARRNAEDNDMVLGVDEYLKNQEKDENLLCIDFKKYYQRMAFFCSRDAELWTDKIAAEDYAVKEARDFVMKDGVQLSFMECNDYLNPKQYMEIFLDQMQSNDSIMPKHKVIIFGHSLGVSDKYILRKLILHDNVTVEIYYHNKKSYRDMLKNLIMVIGHEELIKRTGDRSIVFLKS